MLVMTHEHEGFHSEVDIGSKMVEFWILTFIMVVRQSSTCLFREVAKALFLHLVSHRLLGQPLLSSGILLPLRRRLSCLFQARPLP